MGLIMTWPELPPAVIKICVNIKHCKLGNLFFGIHMWQLTILFFLFYFIFSRAVFVPSYLTQQTLYSSKTASYNSHCSSNTTLLKVCSYLTGTCCLSQNHGVSALSYWKSIINTTAAISSGQCRYLEMEQTTLCQCWHFLVYKMHQVTNKKVAVFWKLCFGNWHMWDNSHKS